MAVSIPLYGAEGEPASRFRVYHRHHYFSHSRTRKINHTDLRSGAFAAVGEHRDATEGRYETNATTNRKLKSVLESVVFCARGVPHDLRACADDSYVGPSNTAKAV